MEKHKIVISIFLILVITAITLLPCFRNGFTNWDDDKLVLNNPDIRELSWQSVRKIFSSYYLNAYIPLTILSYTVEYHFFNLNPRAYHTTNVILHLLNCLLVFWLMYMLSSNIYVSLVTAILFGIHPLRVESVAWIAERKDVLYSFPFLGSLIFYLYYQKKQVMKYYYLALIIFIVSVLAKGMAVTLPIVLLLFDYFLHRGFCRRTFVEKIPFFIITLVFGLVTLLGEKVSEGIATESSFIFFDKILIASYGLVFYLTKLVMPIKLSCYYPYPEKIGDSLPPIFFFSAAITIVLVVVVILFRKRTRIATFGSLFFLITVIPYLQLIPAGQLIADRYTYIASIGIFFIAAQGFHWLYFKKLIESEMLRASLLFVLILIISVLSLFTWQRCQVWKNSITLWDDVLKNYPNVLKAHTQRGLAYYDQKEYDKAITDYSQAILINPNFAGGYNNRGIVYSSYGEFNKAIADFTQALRTDNKYVQAYNNRGLTYIRTGELNKAIDDFNHALSIDPKSTKAYFYRAIAYFMQKEYDKAWDDVKELEGLNFEVSPTFLDTLRKSSQRQR